MVYLLHLCCIALLLSFHDSLAQVFRDSPVHTVALTNNPATLRCCAPDPSPPHTIIWLHNEITASSSGRISISYNGSTGSSEYRISSVNYCDAGVYQCIAFDAQGVLVDSSDTGNLTVQGHPAFASPLSPITVPLGSEAVFECRVLSNPPATVSWFYGHSSEPLSSSDRITVTPLSLTITDVQLSDEGFYQCAAMNSFGPNTTSARLTIGTPPPSLQVTITPHQPDPLTVIEGAELTLRCSTAEGSEVTSLTWFKDSSATVVGVSQDNNGLLLAIPSVQIGDGGSYTCVATGPGNTSDSDTVQVEVYIAPEFQVRPTDIVVIPPNGFLSSIPRCQATGIPEPSISWLRPNGGEVPVDNDGTPQFVGLTRSDTGVYVCVASSPAGEGRAEFTITVEAVPLITDPPRDTLAGYGQDVIFTCAAVGPPDPVISWQRIGGEIPEGNIQTNDLQLFSVNADDSGVYECMATNKYDNATASATLTVLELPRIDSISPAAILTIGQSFTLNCTAFAPPSASLTISWYHNGTLLTPSGDPRVEIFPGGSLQVTNATASHSGVYSCNASTSYAHDTALVTVTVGYAPRITAGPNDTDLIPGETVSLDCVVSSLPPPLISWLKTDEFGNEEQLPLGGRITLFTQRIEIADVVREDSGSYKCVVENGLGSDRQSSRLRVEGAPIATNITPTVLVADDNYELTCTVVYNYPTANVTWSRTDGVSLPPERFNTNNDGKLLISPAEDNDQAEYQCTVANGYGSSNTSANITVHIHPTITFPSLQVTVILDANATLQCPASGRPTPSIQWVLPDRTEIPGNETGGSKDESEDPNRVRFDPSTGELNFTTVNASDSGVYTCMASNMVGNDSGELEVIVRGAAPEEISVRVLSSTVLQVLWATPPPEFSARLLNYELEFGVFGSRDRQVITGLGLVRREYVALRLEEGTTYEFVVHGVYEGGVVGLVVMATGATLETAPTGAPRNISLRPLEEALEISWLPPAPEDQNGVIIHYNIYYRRSSGDDSSPFTRVQYIPTNLADTDHMFVLDNLAGGRSYDVVLQAATVIGNGPNSTIVQATPNTPFPLTLVLAITIPIGSVLLVVAMVILIALCVVWYRHRAQVGKHTPLLEEESFQREKRRNKNKTISGPIPGITPSIDASISGKFSVQAQDGTVLSLNPRVITQDDVAPPPAPGQTVAKVPRAEILKSQQMQEVESPYNLPADARRVPHRGRHSGKIDPHNLPEEGLQQRPSSGVYDEPSNRRKSPPSGLEEGDVDPYAVSRNAQAHGTVEPYAIVGGWQSSDIWTQPILEESEEEEEEEEEEEGTEEQPEDQLSASRNALDLSAEDLSPAIGGYPTEGTHGNDTDLLYAHVSVEHRTKKRQQMLQDQQKREMKARRDQRKMHERMQREKKKREEKTHKAIEKQKKQQDKEQKLRQDLGLGNVVRLHELDLSTRRGKAQAQFIDAATAAIF